MIAETIVGAAEAMELYTSTPKTTVRFVGRMSSRICRTIVVVLILTVRIVNVWYPHHFLHSANPFRHWCLHREVAKWLEQRQREDTSETVFSVHSGKFDIPTASVGLAGTQLSSSIYGTVIFDLTLFNEVTQSDDILTNIRASVIDSYIELSSDYPMYECIGSYIAYPPTSTLLTQPTSSLMRRWTTRRPQ